MSTDTPLSEADQRLCATVAQEWASKGQLVFRRRPQLVAVMLAVVGTICCAFLPTRFLLDQIESPWLLKEAAEKVKWPLADRPERLELCEIHDARLYQRCKIHAVVAPSGDTIKSISVASFFVDSDGNLDPYVQIIDQSAVQAEFGPTPGATRVTVVGSYRTPGGPIQDWKIGVPIHIQRKAEELDTQDKLILGAFLGALVLGAALGLGYILYELSKWRRGNEIVLTHTAFIQKSKTLFGRGREVCIPWECVRAREESKSVEGNAFAEILYGLASPGEKLIVEGGSGVPALVFSSITVVRYAHLRAALIAKCGLAVHHEVERWRYE